MRACGFFFAIFASRSECAHRICVWVIHASSERMASVPWIKTSSGLPPEINECVEYSAGPHSLEALVRNPVSDEKQGETRLKKFCLAVGTALTPNKVVRGQRWRKINGFEPCSSAYHVFRSCFTELVGTLHAVEEMAAFKAREESTVISSIHSCAVCAPSAPVIKVL